MPKDDALGNASGDRPPEDAAEDRNAGSHAGQATTPEMSASPFEKPDLESMDLSRDPPPDPEPDVTLTPFEAPETERLLEGDDEGSSTP